MKLYHYAFKKEILSEGIEGFHKHNDTKIINNLISNEFNGECFGRDYCIFFNLDKRDDGYLTVSVDSSKLDSNLLFVANQNIANLIYKKWYKGNDTSEAVKEYVSSIKKLSEYNNEYENPEVFYLDDISPDLLHLEEIDEGCFEE